MITNQDQLTEIKEIKEKADSLRGENVLLVVHRQNAEKQV